MAEQEDIQKQQTATDVNSWLGKVSHARDIRDDRAKRYRWREIGEEFKGKWPINQEGYDISILPINLVFAYVKTELPSLYIRDPRIKVNPKNRTSIWTSKVFEAVINYIWACKKIKREIKKCIVDALLIGHAWFKVGYTGQFGTVEENGQTIETIESEDFFGYRIPWDCITFDPDAIDPPYDCSWIAHDVWLSPEDVKNNPRYNPAVVDTLQVGYEPAKYPSNHEDERKRGKICVTEVWDMKRHVVFSIAPGAEDYLEAPKQWPYEMKGFPFSYLKFNFVNDDPWGIGDVLMAEPQFLEKIKMRSSEVDHLKRFNRQVFAETDAFASVDEESKFTQGITGAIIKLNPGGLAKIKLTDFGALNPDMYGIEDRIDNDAANVLGQTAAERGGQAKTSTRTIRELNVQIKGAENRRSEKIDIVEDFVEEIAGNMSALVKQFAPDNYYVRILGVNSPELQKAVAERASASSPEAVTNQGGFTFTVEDIQGDYDIEVVAGSATPIDQEEMLKMLFQALEILPNTGAVPGGPMYAAVGRMIAEAWGSQELLNAMEEEEKVQQQMKQEQAQQQQEMMQMQVAQVATDTQIKAEAAAAKHSKNQIELLRVQNEREALQQKDEEPSGEDE